MSNPTGTTTRRLADVLLDGKLDEYVAERRAAGKSWRRITLDLRDDTAIDITHGTLRSWYPDEPGDDSDRAEAS